MRKADFEAAEAGGQVEGDAASAAVYTADGTLEGTALAEGKPGALPASGSAAGGAAMRHAMQTEGAGPLVPALAGVPGADGAAAAASAAAPKKSNLPQPKFEATSRLVTSLDERLQVRPRLIASTLQPLWAVHRPGHPSSRKTPT